MTRMVHCVKLEKESEGLVRPPYPGELGQRIYENISQDAWDAWVKLQTMMINEYRMSMLDPEARKFLAEKMEKYLFEKDTGLIASVTPCPCG